MTLSMPQPIGVRQHTNYSGRPSDTKGTAVVAGGTAHTLSTGFTELIATLNFDSYWVTVFFLNTLGANTQTDSLVNIYVGAASAEQILIPTLLAGWSSGAGIISSPRYYHFPLFVPAGSRISAKSQSITVSKSIRTCIGFQGGGTYMPWAGKSVECLGANTAASQGTSVTPGTTAEGTFTTIGTSVNDYHYVLPMIQGTLADTAMAFNWIGCDIGVGSASYKGLDDFIFQTNTTEMSCPMMPGIGRWTFIPGATALQLRGQNNGSTAEPFDACIYGVSG